MSIKELTVKTNVDKLELSDETLDSLAFILYNAFKKQRLEKLKKTQNNRSNNTPDYDKPF